MTAGGLPHSETLGSKPCRRLPEDYRGPTRPSSVLSAKASTTAPFTTTRPPAPTGTHGRPSRTHNEKHKTVSNWNTRLSDHHTHQPHPTTGHGRHETNERTHTPHNRDASRPHQPQRTDAPRFIHSTNTNHTQTDAAVARVHSPVLKPPPHHKPARHDEHAAPDPWARNTHPTQGAWRSGDPTACTAPPPTHRAGNRSLISSTPAGTTPTPTRAGNTSSRNGRHTGAPQNSVERR